MTVGRNLKHRQKLLKTPYPPIPLAFVANLTVELSFPSTDIDGGRNAFNWKYSRCVSQGFFRLGFGLLIYPILNHLLDACSRARSDL